MEKWKYHKKQPAVQTMIKYNSLRLLTHILQIAVIMSWLAWIALSARELNRSIVGRELVEGVKITTDMGFYTIFSLMTIIGVFLGITIWIIHPLGGRAIMGALAVVIVPLSLISFFVSVAMKQWLAMLICLVLYFVYLVLKWAGKHYRNSIHRQTYRNSNRTSFYVTCSLDEVVSQEKLLFPVSENWETYTSEVISEMKVSKELFIIGSNLLYEEQLGPRRDIQWTKMYRYKGMSHHLQLTNSIQVLSKVDYLRFVGECLQSGRNIFHVGEHIVGVVLSESISNGGVLSKEGAATQEENARRDEVSKEK